MVTPRIAWDDQIGRRLKLRDLHVFFTVAKSGSMAKAATQLAVAQPTVSEVITDLEHTFGVRLFDRSSRGVEPTAYGRALLKRAIAVFDELKQTTRDIEYLADPTSGELKIACPESIAAAILPAIAHRIAEQYPNIVLSVDSGNTSAMLEKLRDRNLDLVLARTLHRLPASSREDLNVELLYEDELVLAVGAASPYARRSKIDLADLVNERWILTERDSWNYEVVSAAFTARGLDMPKIGLKTLSVHVRTNMLATGRFVTALPRSVLHLYGERFSLKILPVSLPSRPWPVHLARLKNRTLSPVVERFLEICHAAAKPLRGAQKS